MLLLLCVLSALSGAGGLVGAVIMTHQFGNLFGSRLQPSLLAISVLLLAGGAGALFAGAWADRQGRARTHAWLASFARLEWALAGLALLIVLLLPALGGVSGVVSFYARGANGWYSIAWSSSALRAAAAAILFGPPAFLFGATLALLARYLASTDPRRTARRVGLMWGSTVVGGGVGAAIAGLWLAPAVGFRLAAIVAVGLNVAAGFGALWLRSRPVPLEPVAAPAPSLEPAADVEPAAAGERRRSRGSRRSRREPAAGVASRLPPTPGPNAAVLTNIAVALSAAAAMGLALLWLRHFTLVVGPFQSTFAVLLAIATLALGLGSMAGALLAGAVQRPAQWLMGALALFAITMFAGIAMTDVAAVLAATGGLATAPDGGAMATPGRLAELWLGARPMLTEVAIPAFVLGFVLPLASGIAQQPDDRVGARIGGLFTAAAVGGTGGLLVSVLSLPLLGLQNLATLLGLTAGLAATALDLATRGGAPRVRSALAALLGSLAVVGLAVVFWLALPAGGVLARATVPQADDERLLTFREGADAFVAVTESPSRGRSLVTDDHFVTGSSLLGARAMRALVHLPLALLDRPERVLIVGFNVGHAAQAAALHPSVQRVDIVEPLPQVLSDADYFSDLNGGILKDRRVRVFVNDGRQHLRMQSQGSYDVIALAPMSAVLDGSTALYAKELYALGRTRLKPGGYLAQTLPVYEVAPGTLLGMIRAFTDVFPQSVLLGATDQEFLLVGRNATTDARIVVDPVRLAARLAAPPALVADLQRVNLSTPVEVLSTFVAPAETLVSAAKAAAPLADDRPEAEFAARSRITAIRGGGVPTALLNLDALSTWCPRCFSGGAPIADLRWLEDAMPLLRALYTQSLPPESGAGSTSDASTSAMIQREAFLQALIAQHTARRNALGSSLASAGKFDAAIAEFRKALRLAPDSAQTHWNLGRALASRGQPRDAVAELRRAVALDPKAGPPHYDLASTLLDLDEIDAAIDEFRAALVVMPNSAESHNNLGIALGRKGRLADAIGEFQQALKIDPNHGEARHNLDAALQAARAGAPTR